MKRLAGILILLTLVTANAVSQASGSGPASAQTTTALTLPSGTRVLLALKNSLNTRRSREGDGVYLEAIEPVVSGGRIVIPQGTSFQGTIRSAQRSGKLKGRASLQLGIDRIIFRNGYVIDLNATLKSADSNNHQAVEDKEGTIRAESTIMRDVLLTGTGALGGGAGGGATGLIIGATAGNAELGGQIGAGAGIAIGLVSALLARGQDVTLDPGSSVEIQFQRPLELDPGRLPEGSTANYVPPQRPAQPSRPERTARSRPLPLPFPRLPF